MKTTVDIPDSLFDEAKKLAAREGVTMKTLLLESLRRILQEKKKRGAFHLRKATFQGEGLQPAFQGASWEVIRDAAHEGRGS